MTGRLRSVSRETLLAPVHLWRLVSRLLPPRCKYHPSCSAYCLQAVRQRGVLVGGALTMWRLLRCNPWSLGGVDPVPPRPGSTLRSRFAHKIACTARKRRSARILR